MAATTARAVRACCCAARPSTPTGSGSIKYSDGAIQPFAFLLELRNYAV